MNKKSEQMLTGRATASV